MEMSTNSYDVLQILFFFDRVSLEAALAHTLHGVEFTISQTAGYTALGALFIQLSRQPSLSSW